jgi:hypothetical protein
MVVEALVPNACNLYVTARRGERRYNVSSLHRFNPSCIRLIVP